MSLRNKNAPYSLRPIELMNWVHFLPLSKGHVLIISPTGAIHNVQRLVFLWNTTTPSLIVKYQVPLSIESFITLWCCILPSTAWTSASTTLTDKWNEYAFNFQQIHGNAERGGVGESQRSLQNARAARFTVNLSACYIVEYDIELLKKSWTISIVVKRKLLSNIRNR